MSSNPAPASSTSATAISPTTSVRRRRSWPAPNVRPAVGSKDSGVRARVARSAGIRPQVSAVSSEAPNANAITQASIRIISRRGMRPPGASARSAGTVQWATSRPAAPPASARMALSTSSCRTSRDRVAPRATRTASSRRRCAPRASSRCATLAHATSRTKITAPAKIDSGRRTCPTSSSLRGMSPIVQVEPSAGGWCGKSRRTLSNCARACSMVRSGFSRPITGNIMLFPAERRTTCGVQASTPAGNWKPAGMMPMTTRRTPFNVTSRPSTDMSPP